MGAYISTQRAAARARAKSRLIDRQIKEDSEPYRRKCLVLLLGSSGSGKSTMLKKMKITYQGGFSTSELAEFRPTVYKNVLESAQAIVVYMRKIGLECADAANNIHCDEILNYKLDVAPGSLQNPYFSPDIANAIHWLWKDPIIINIMDEHLGRFYLIDSAVYFVNQVLRIGMSGYLPNTADVLHAYRKSSGITEAEFMMDQLSIRIVDVGDQSPFGKWTHCFTSATSIAFCAAISEYDQVLVKGRRSENRLTESIIFFKSMIISPWFSRTSFILYLTKIDVFNDKLPKVPLERYFPKYTGGSDAHKATEYILQRFKQTHSAGLRVRAHLTQATDTTDVASLRLMPNVVKDTILRNHLKDRNLL